MFQALRTEAIVTDDGLAVNGLRKGLSWFSDDVKMALSSDLTDGAPAVSSVIFTWSDEYLAAGTAHTASYTIASGKLVRSYDGQSHTVANNVVSASFSRSGRSATASVEVNAAAGETRTQSATSVMRPTP